jgi:putative ABC transport system substrate-binding protein
MISRRQLLITLGSSPFVVPFGSLAQQQGKVWRMGFLFAGTLAQRPQVRGFWEGLKELGYIPGKNILIEIREAEGKTERLPDLAKELVSWKPDVIVAVTPPSVAAAQSATRSIPIVMAITGDISRYGFVKNVARPEGNITGTTSYFGALHGKRLQLLKEMLPHVSRIGVLWNAKNAYGTTVQQVEESAKMLGVHVTSLPFQGPNDLESGLIGAIRERCEALLVLSDAVTFDLRAKVIAFSAEKRLPTFYQFPEEAYEGGLAAYGVNLLEEYRRVGPYVDKILKGVKPSELPIEQPTVFEMVINVKTAKALGIKIPNSILLRADKVIE